MTARLLVRLTVVAAVVAGARSERPLPLPGCPPARLSAQLPGSTLSRLVEHACVSPPQLQLQLEPCVEDRDSASSGRPRLPQTLQLEDADKLETRCGPTDHLAYQLDDSDAWPGVGDGGSSSAFDWRGWLAPIQQTVPGELCRNHSRAYVQELLRAAPTPWAVRMADASGKLPDGLLYGNVNLLGSWDGCRSVRVRLNDSEYPEVEELRFSGQLCSAVITATDNSSAGQLGLAPALPLLARAGLPLQAVRYAYCVPSSCDTEDVRASLSEALNGSGLAAVVSDCHAEGERAQLDAGDWALVVFLALTAAALLVCTALDVAASCGLQLPRLRQRRRNPLPVYQGTVPEKAPAVLIRAFSLYRSVPRLLSTATEPRTIGCLHGLRCLTMAWIVLGHIYIVGMFLLPINNLGRMPELIQPLPFQVIMNAMPAVDTFLVISGALVSAGLAREERAGRRVGPRRLLALYLHRYLRLTPLYAVVVWFTATLLRHIGNGTFSGVNFAVFGVTGCRSSWWHNLLYINNFYPNDEKVCIDQSWYLALDMQLFLVAPLLVLPVLRWPRAGAFWLASAAAISVIIPGVITYIWDLPPTLLNLNTHATEPQLRADFTLLVYNAPWSRAAPYIVGLALGLLLGGVVPAPRPSRLVCGLLWTLSTAVALLVLLGMWRYNSEPDALWTPAVAVSYAALHRPAWALCIAWVIWACVNGYGRPVDALLSHAVWRPLSRLTYATYLMSIQLMVWYVSQARAPVAGGHVWFVYWFLADLLINVAVATVFSLAIEWPAAALEKAVREMGGSAATDRGSRSKDGDERILSMSKRDFQ